MVVHREGTDVDADRPTGDPAGHPGIVHRFLGDLQQQPLLRVHGRGFARRDPEELRVEVPQRVLQEPAAAGVHPARHVRVGVVVAVQAPPVRGHLDDPVAMSEQEVPQLVGPVHLAWQPASDSHDRYIHHADDLPYL